MSADRPGPANAPAAGSGDRLRRDAVGVAGIVFFVAAAAGPMAATVGASPLTFAANGIGTPGAYALAAIVLLVFSVGFAAMARYVSSAGGFAVLVSRGLGRRAGYVAAALALLAYNGVLLGIYGLFAFFANSIFKDLIGLDLPWQAWAAIALVLVAFLGYRDVNLSAKVLGALMVCEVLILLIFSVVVLAKGGQSGLTSNAFHPDKIFSGSAGLAFLFAFSSFIGFEATTIYGEEARDRDRTVPRATYVAVLLIGGFYVLSTYAIAAAYGDGGIVAAAKDHPGDFVFTASTRYLGGWSADVMKVLLVTSLFAVLLALHNTVSRYLYALGRGGFLPGRLGRTHRVHESPHLASLVETVVTVLVVGAFVVAGADPFAALYSWLVGLGTVGILSLQALASFAVIGFFHRSRVDRRLWQTRIAPVLGAVGLIVAIVLAVRNFNVLTGVNSGPVTLLPWTLLVMAVVGLIVGEVRSRQGASLEGGFTDEPAAAASGPVGAAGPRPTAEQT